VSETPLNFVGVEPIDSLRSEWSALAGRLDAPPTATPAWIDAWWHAFGKGDLRIYAGRRDGELIAVLPLSSASHRSLSSPSNVHTPVFEALTASPEYLEQMVRAVLADSHGGLNLGQVDGGGPLATTIGKLVKAGESRAVGADARPSSRVAADSWEAFEATLRKKRLSDCRRGMRKLEEEGDVVFDVWDGKERERAFQEFLRLEATPWKLESRTAISQDEATRRFYSDLIDLAVPGGPARLAFMRVGEKPVAVQLMITGGGRRFGLKTGFDADYAKASVGVIHLFDELRIALDAGLVFELGTGDEALKQELRTASWPLEALGAFPASLRGGLGRGVLGLRMRMYERARHNSLARRVYGALRGRDAS
jgi:CelD/BcsL family acetyltransferase involved in cellulose biosynthesis